MRGTRGVRIPGHWKMCNYGADRDYSRFELHGKPHHAQ